jgi:hypothetical protein
MWIYREKICVSFWWETLMQRKYPEVLGIDKVKVKQSRYRPEVAQTVPGS